MNKAAATYMKREFRKVMPVFILAALYAGAVCAVLYQYLCDQNTDMRLLFAYPQNFSGRTGDVLIVDLCRVLEKIHLIAVILLEILLIWKVFYLENRAGICDFLTILPVRQRDKILMKLCAGESVILGFCLLFGILGSAVNAALNPGLSEMNAFVPNMARTVNSYAMLWQIVLMMFLSMSAIFLVLFVAQCCVHNVVVATFTGIGILLAPIYYTFLNYSMTMQGRDLMEVAIGLVHPSPDGNTILMHQQSPYNEIAVSLVQWDTRQSMFLFLTAVIVIALGVLVLALRLRWNIRESDYTLINSSAVSEFLITGFSISVGTAVACFSGYTINMTPEGMTGDSYKFFVVSLIAGAVVWAVAHVIVAVNARRQRAM